MDLRKEIAADLHAERFDVTSAGIYFPRQSVLAKGEYFHRVNKGAWELDPNLVVTEGLALMLNVALGAAAKPAGFFLALFAGAAAPAANWTAASFAATAGEITSLTEGYSQATRPAWTPAPANGGSIDNFASVATFSIVTSGTLTVTGAALLTNNTRGGTTGALVSATKYAAARTFQNGDEFDVGYRMSLTV